jgi:hypothetical protein
VYDVAGINVMVGMYENQNREDDRKKNKSMSSFCPKSNITTVRLPLVTVDVGGEVAKVEVGDAGYME